MGSFSSRALSNNLMFTDRDNSIVRKSFFRKGKIGCTSTLHLENCLLVWTIITKEVYSLLLFSVLVLQMIDKPCAAQIHNVSFRS